MDATSMLRVPRTCAKARSGTRRREGRTARTGWKEEEKRASVVVRATAQVKEELWNGGQALAGVVAFRVADRGAKILCDACGIAFPAPLVGMAAVLATLLVSGKYAPKTGVRVQKSMAPALAWIQKWMPLFYVPSLVALPLAAKDVPSDQAARLALLIVGGAVVSLTSTAALLTAIAKKTPPKGGINDDAIGAAARSSQSNAAAKGVAETPFTLSVFMEKLGELGKVWLGITLASFGAATVFAKLGQAQAGHWATQVCLLGSLVTSYLAGKATPPNVQSIMHPIAACALGADIVAYALAAATDQTFDAVLFSFLSRGKNSLGVGAGDLLMGFLGSVVWSFGFRVYAQRDLIRENARLVFGTIGISPLISLFGTVTFGRLLGLRPDLVLAAAPRSVTVALALPIAQRLGAEALAPVTAACVVVTGLIGANFAQAILTKMGVRPDPIRGLATASSAHGLGTAALAATEPEAMPFCALAYALIAVASTGYVFIPFVRDALIAIAGNIAATGV
mmetsp:Transcript_9690/g.34373  ORF Transcript_9690/g.34373 Transcript_9690/m.34373 type:complete len:509 (-) Transcript_9690:91-1617(-)